MEQLFTHLVDRKRFAEAEFAARVGVPVLVYKPGRQDDHVSTSVGVYAPPIDWKVLKDQIREESSQYRVVRLALQRPSPARIVVIGRGQQNEVVLNDASVSKRHAAIHVREDGLFVVDLNSRNGTKVDGNVVGNTLKPLKTPARLTFGQVEARCLDPKHFYAFLGELLL